MTDIKTGYSHSAGMWWAWHDGEDRGGEHCGSGNTEAEAIADLKRLDNERAEWEETQQELQWRHEVEK